MKTTSKALLFLAALSMSSLLNSCCEDGFRNTIESEPKEQWIGVLNPLFNGIEMRLNNFQPERHRFFPDQERAYLLENDSHIALLGERIDFNIPVTRREPLSIYVDNINSQRISIDAQQSRAIISVAMESSGREIWTNCVANAGCFAIGDRDVNVDDMIIDIGLDIIAEGGQVTYNTENIEVEVRSSSVRIDGCNDNLFAFLCDIFLPDRESRIKTAIANSFKNTLTLPAIRQQISNALTRYVRDVMGVEGEIVSATVLGNGTLTIGHRERDVTCD